MFDHLYFMSKICMKIQRNQEIKNNFDKKNIFILILLNF